MEVRVEVSAENPISGLKTHTNTAYLVYVALNEEGRPKPVPQLVPESDLEKLRMAAGKKRQAYRLAQREEEKQENPRG
jgi:acyl-CoA hydrolase